MKTKTILKTLAVALLMPAMLLTTACSSDDNIIDSEKSANTKGYALPVTVNVTRQGDEPATRATFDGSKLAFSAGDKLFVSGNDNSDGGAGSFAGALDYVPATGKFSGTIYTKNNYDGTADALFSAASSVRANLLPNGYDSYNFLYINNKNTDVLYDDVVGATISEAFVASETAKKTGVEQLSWEQAYTYSSGFALAPANAVLNFTISGLEAGEKAVTLITKYSGIDSDQTMSGSVTPNASGVATFAIGVPNNLVIKNVANNLTVGSRNITLPGNTPLVAGKIYNINRSASAPLPAVFTVDAGKTVKFSKGNLQATYNGSSWIWGFAEHQWDYIGNAAGNTSINGNGTVSANGTVDLFGWVGASSTWTGAAQYGISNSTTTNNVDGYGNVAGEAQKVGWGATVGTGWRTLTRPEWLYLLSTRETSITVNSTDHARYTLAIINTDGTEVKGLIIFPDGYTGGTPAGVTWGTINAKSTYETTCTSAGWTALEAAGCVFLPAAGYREASTVTDAGIGAGYWSSSSSDVKYAFGLYFESDYMTIQYGGNRKYGFSVRLVRDAD